MKIEQERGISVTTAVMTFQFEGRTFNLLDTPGHEDFSEDTYRTLTAADSAVMVIDAAKRRDSGLDVSMEASCAKYFATEMCGRVADRAVQMSTGCDRRKSKIVQYIQSPCCDPLTLPTARIFFDVYDPSAHRIYTRCDCLSSIDTGVRALGVAGGFDGN